jgi:hypothetical protein
MTNEQHPLDDLMHSLMNNIPITKDQAQEAVKIEFLELQEHFGEEFAQQLYLTVLMNSYVDRRFSSEEYADLQNERMIKLATIFSALLQIFKKNPQSFTGNCEVLQVFLPGTTARGARLNLIYNGIESIIGVTTESIRLSL